MSAHNCMHMSLSANDNLITFPFIPGIPEDEEIGSSDYLSSSGNLPAAEWNAGM